MAAIAAVFVVAVTGVSFANPDLALDPSFGNGGRVVTSFSAGSESARALLIQPDGKLVAAGDALVDFTTVFGLVRYLPDGSLDPSFGTGGLVTADLKQYGYEFARAVVLQPDGRIVVAGESIAGASMVVGRFNVDGTVDLTFGLNGFWQTPLDLFSTAAALVIQPDGKLVAAGTISGSTSDSIRVALVRYKTDGRGDPTFGPGGFVISDVADSFDALVLQPDGRLVAAGRTGFGTGARFALARYQSDGQPDPTFGVDGVVTTQVGVNEAEIFSLALQPDGKLVAAGRARFDVPPHDASLFVIARYNADGSLDAGFGGGGIVSLPVAERGSRAAALALAPDGKIVAAGFTTATGAQPDFDFAVVRLEANGTLDPTFGTGGRVTTDFAHNWDQVNAVIVQPDGKVVAAGGAYERQTGMDYGLARYLTATPARCTPAPRSGCRAPQEPLRAWLAVRDNPSNKRDRIVWKWLAGDTMTLGDFGDPTTSDDYTVCVYDEAGAAPSLIVEATAPAGATCATKPCWTSLGAEGFAFRDGVGGSDGLQQVTLRLNRDGRGTITVKARGPGVPSFPGGLPLGVPSRVQLQATGGECWEATFSSVGVRRNDDESFRGRAD